MKKNSNKEPKGIKKLNAKKKKSGNCSVGLLYLRRACGSPVMSSPGKTLQSNGESPKK